jgi:hypothetical protein
MDTPSTIDPIRIPTITLTGEEIDEIRAEIKEGRLPADYLDRYAKAVRDNVFGADHKTDKNGRPIEQGIGAKSRETLNHFAALKKAEASGQELPGTYDKAVAALVKRDPERAKKLGLVAA